MADECNKNLKKILKVLNKYDNNEIKDIVKHYIDKAQANVYDMNFDTDTIGYQSDINGNVPDIKNLAEMQEIHIYGTPFWLGFIPNNIKIVYSFEIRNCSISNSGYYYYMNDYNYIYDFAKYIKGKNIKDDLSFMKYTYDYIRKYFFSIHSNIDRDQLHHLIMDTNYKYYEPEVEHNITDFKGTGSAKCSEYAAMFQNILSVFGYDSVYIHGELDDEEEKHSCHAYNLSVIDDTYSIVDLALPINCIDYARRTQKTYPYICCLEGFDEENLDEFLMGDKELQLCDLEAQIINDEYYTFTRQKKRVYRVDQMHILDE